MRRCSQNLPSRLLSATSNSERRTGLRRTCRKIAQATWLRNSQPKYCEVWITFWQASVCRLVSTGLEGDSATGTGLRPRHGWKGHEGRSSQETGKTQRWRCKQSSISAIAVRTSEHGSLGLLGSSACGDLPGVVGWVSAWFEAASIKCQGARCSNSPLPAATRCRMEASRGHDETTRNLHAAHDQSSSCSEARSTGQVLHQHRASIHLLEDRLVDDLFSFSCSSPCSEFLTTAI